MTLHRALFILALAGALVSGYHVVETVSATDPTLSNVPVGQTPDLFVWTTQTAVGPYVTTDCEVQSHSCRTRYFMTEDEVVAWVYRLQQEFWVEYLS